MSTDRTQVFFHRYANDFDAIYSNRGGLLNGILNGMFRKSMKLRYLKTIEGCQPIQGKTALDVGCGPGHYAITLAQRGAARVLGIDFAEGMLHIAAERGMGHVHGDEAVLKNINLRVPEGTSLAIVGPTGSGKSTLVSLIPRIYDAAEGSVLIDGRPIGEFPLEVLRRHIGFVPQETFLFSDTIRENIAFGAEQATDADVRRAAEAANIADEIESFPHGYDTLVGERGLTLSGGQKQRTAIARALIRSPRILVLDDALASVDTQTEDRILNHLREIMQGRTTIFISHRVSTVRNADCIAVLHDGQIVEY